MGDSCSRCQPCNTSSAPSQTCFVKVEVDDSDVTQESSGFAPNVLLAQRHPSTSSQHSGGPAEQRTGPSADGGYGMHLDPSSIPSDPRHTRTSVGPGMRSISELQEQPHHSLIGWNHTPSDMHAGQVQAQRFSERVQTEITNLRQKATSFSNQYHQPSIPVSMPQGLFFGEEAVDAYVSYDKSSDLQCNPTFYGKQASKNPYRMSNVSLPPTIAAARATSSNIPGPTVTPEFSFGRLSLEKKSVVKFYIPQEQTAENGVIQRRSSKMSNDLSFY
eukprot:GEMP01021457.1.p1 GENE.GEMP01021457.1~~GEMP01021457.1.p1  ORF type:complete len:274 (+),score=30.80 GEMP01021457.1:276-1097(+)